MLIASAALTPAVAAGAEAEFVIARSSAPPLATAEAVAKEQARPAPDTVHCGLEAEPAEPGAEAICVAHARDLDVPGAVTCSTLKLLTT